MKILYNRFIISANTLPSKLEYNIRCHFSKVIGGSRVFVPEYSPVISSVDEYKKKVQEEVCKDKATTDDFADSNTKYCSICWENPVDCVLLPCAHVGVCSSCFKDLKEKDCPFCRRSVLQVSKLFFC